MPKHVWPIIGAAGIIFGLLVAFTPFHLVPVCTETMQTTMGMQVPMRCYHTGRAEVILGSLTVVVGAVVLLVGQAAARKTAGAMLGLLGLGVIALPSKWGIGMCAKAHMACHATAPVLYGWGGLLLLAGVVALAVPLEAKRRTPTSENV